MQQFEDAISAEEWNRDFPKHAPNAIVSLSQEDVIILMQHHGMEISTQQLRDFITLFTPQGVWIANEANLPNTKAE